MAGSTQSGNEAETEQGAVTYERRGPVAMVALDRPRYRSIRDSAQSTEGRQ